MFQPPRKKRIPLFLIICAIHFQIHCTASLANPYLLMDMIPGRSSYTSCKLMPVGDHAYFVMEGIIWRTDGTSSGTFSLGNMPSLNGNNMGRYLGHIGEVMIFEAYDAYGYRSIWRTDKSVAGTYKLKDLVLPSGQNDKDVAKVGSTLFFYATDARGEAELWKTDGTVAGTTKLLGLGVAARSGSGPQNLTKVGETLFFTTEHTLWKSNGTSESTVQVRNDLNPYSLTDINGTLFFAAQTESYGLELWKSDGTTSGTVLVKDINPGGQSSSIVTIYNLNGIAYFIANDGIHGYELWKSNGTPQDTTMVKDTYPGSNGIGIISSAANVNGVLVFLRGGDIWRSDGTEAGTFKIIDIYTSYDLPCTAVVGGKLFCAATSLEYGEELWESDGTTSGTKLVMDIREGFYGSSPQSLIKVGEDLIFTADDGVHGRELWALQTTNNPPIIASLSDQRTPAGQAYKGPKPILEEGLTSVTWTLAQGPSGMTINVQTGEVSWLTPTITTTPITITIRATNPFGQATASWHLTVYDNSPPTAPRGGAALAYHILEPSRSPSGQPVLYTYVWTSDRGDRVSHGPTTLTTDVLTETNLVNDGETWSVMVTPSSNNVKGPTVIARVKIINIQTGVVTWQRYR